MLSTWSECEHRGINGSLRWAIVRQLILFIVLSWSARSSLTLKLRAGLNLLIMLLKLRGVLFRWYERFWYSLTLLSLVCVHRRFGSAACLLQGGMLTFNSVKEYQNLLYHLNMQWRKEFLTLPCSLPQESVLPSTTGAINSALLRNFSWTTNY